MQKDDSMLLVDTGGEEWYEYRTIIPGAINIHYVYIMKPKNFKEEYQEALITLGIFGKRKPFDFSQAKTILLFCNGAWCSPITQNGQSSAGFMLSAGKNKAVQGGNG